MLAISPPKTQKDGFVAEILDNKDLGEYLSLVLFLDLGSGLRDRRFHDSCVVEFQRRHASVRGKAHFPQTTARSQNNYP